MKIQYPCGQATNQLRVSLETKIRLLARKFRTAERRRKRAEKRLCRRSELPWLSAGVLTVALLLSVTISFAATTAPTFEQANTTFAAGNYPAAISQYEAILARDGYSAPVLFNLGNACYRDGQFGAAILSYERAQVLAPRDGSIAANLRLARQKTGVPAQAPNGFQQAARMASPNTLAWIGSFSLMVICLTIGVGRLLPRFTQSRALVAVAVATLLAVGASIAIRWPDFDRAIVITAKAPARIAPASTAAESFALRAGEAVTVQKLYGQFILARTSDGRSGWVSRNEIGRVFVPRSGPVIPTKL